MVSLLHLIIFLFWLELRPEMPLVELKLLLPVLLIIWEKTGEMNPPFQTYYATQLRGHSASLINFYSLADNLSIALRHVRWTCMESARKTLATKHKIHKVSHTYQRYFRKGQSQLEWKHIQVAIERENKPPLVAKCGETPLRTRKISFISDNIPPNVIAGKTSELLTRLLVGKCELCHRVADLEAHHVNKLKHLRQRWQGRKHKPEWVQNMIARRRKTIVVCHSCHQQITHGRYDGQRVN